MIIKAGWFGIILTCSASKLGKCKPEKKLENVQTSALLFLLPKYASFVCLFICLGFFIPLKYFSLILRRHLCRIIANHGFLSTSFLSIMKERFEENHPWVTDDGEGLQILTCARHSWPLSSENSLACHTYCDTGHPFDLWNFNVVFRQETQ